ncbi:MAG: FluC/FEX family fluoride channel [Nocardioidaceae bacterium]
MPIDPESDPAGDSESDAPNSGVFDVFREPPPSRRTLRARLRRHADVAAVIAVGGGLGSLARYGVSRWLSTDAGEFPWSTFLVNVVGCAVLGALMVFIVDVWRPGRYLRPFLAVGVLGGLTTFSTLALDARGLGADRAWLLANLYVFGSLLAGLLALWLGLASARVVTGIPTRRRRSRHEGTR